MFGNRAMREVWGCEGVRVWGCGALTSNEITNVPIYHSPFTIYHLPFVVCPMPHPPCVACLCGVAYHCNFSKLPWLRRPLRVEV